ncbi:hypothetical protein D3C78_614380 [compost metagenome]
MDKGELFKSARNPGSPAFLRVKTRLAIALSGAMAIAFYSNLQPTLPLGGFDPASVFAGGAQGVFFDASDLKTLYQETAGVTPTTAAGQYVGLQFDKSKGASVSTINSATLTTVAGVPIGGPTLTQYTIATGLVVGRWYKVSATVSGYSGSATVGFTSGSSAFGANSNGALSTGYGTLTGNGKIEFVALAAASTQTIFTRDTNTATFSNISIREIAGNHRFQATSADRPILRYNWVTGAHYLEYNGSNSWMVTNAIDFTATDKVSVFAGLRKLSDAARGVFVELGNNQNGTFVVDAPVGTPPAGSPLRFISRGTLAPEAAALVGDASLYAPVSLVVAGFGDISAPLARLMVNGVQVAQTLSSQGSGNYIAASIHFGRRAGTSLPFNGHEYVTLIVGLLTTAEQTKGISQFCARRVGVQLAA